MMMLLLPVALKTPFQLALPIWWDKGPASFWMVFGADLILTRLVLSLTLTSVPPAAGSYQATQLTWWVQRAWVDGPLKSTVQNSPHTHQGNIVLETNKRLTSCWVVSGDITNLVSITHLGGYPWDLPENLFDFWGVDPMGNLQNLSIFKG